MADTAEELATFEVVDGEEMWLPEVLRLLLGEPGTLVELSGLERWSITGRITRVYSEAERLRWLEVTDVDGGVVRVRWSSINRVAPVVER